MERSQLSTALHSVFEPHAVIDQGEALQPYCTDWIKEGITGQPDVVVHPMTSEQVAQAVRIAAQANVPVVARGAGTGLAGGARPLHGGVVICTTEMTVLDKVDFANRRALIQPGIINYDLSQQLLPHGYFYAPDPASWQICTVGGNIANNSGGPRCLKYGVTSNHILALELIRDDGSVLWTGDGISDAAGYDLTGLIVGSEGTLGVVTQAMIRLTRTPESNRVILALFPDVVATGEAVSAIVATGYLPTALEVMDATTIEAVNKAFQFGLPDTAGAALIVEIDGVEEGLDDMLREILALCEHYGAVQVQSAVTPEEQQRLWSARKSAFTAFPVLAPAYQLVDTAVPRTRLPAMMAHVQRLAQEYDMLIANVFHAGDGNLHPLVLYDPAHPEHVAKAEAITKEVLRLSIEEGGTISGEHGIGVEKQDFMAKLLTTAELQTMAELYAVFNPHNRFNPSKVFPTNTNPLDLAAQRQARLRTNQHFSVNGHTDNLQEKMHAIIGSTYVLTGNDVVDYTVEGQAPHLVVFPADIEQLSKVMAACHQSGATVIPWGGGTQQQHGSLTYKPDVVVVTRRLNGVLKYEPNDLTVGVEAGMTLAELQTLLAPHNQMLPLDAPLPEHATLGGLVATATDGPRRLGYGLLRDMLLGLTIVEVDGTIVQCGGQVVKNVSGYDLVRLFLGSYGTLGIIAGVNLRTYPSPKSESTLLALFEQHDQACALIDELAQTQLQPRAVEYLNQHALAQIGVVGHYGVAIRTDGVTVACKRHISDMTTMAQRAGAIETRELLDDDLRTLWSGIANLSTAHIDVANAVLLRIAVLPTNLAEAIAHVEERAEAYGASATIHARAIDGVLYAHIRGLQQELSSLQQELVERWRHSHVLACEPILKADLQVWGGVPDGVDIMQEMKQRFDPFEKLNPGRYVV
ncbi:MAG: FAD-binding protein [Chloroflexota bacterium]